MNWTVDEYQGRILIRNEAGRGIAEVYEDLAAPGPREEALKVARLISAAPDLLEAVEAYLTRNSLTSQDHISFLRQATAKAFGAGAKARLKARGIPGCEEGR